MTLTVDWSEIALFSILENLHISVDQLSVKISFSKIKGTLINLNFETVYFDF